LPDYLRRKEAKALSGVRWSIESCLNATRYDVRSLRVVDSMTEVKAEAWTTQGDKYSRSCTWKKNYANYKVTVLKGSTDIMNQEGLSSVHGMPTLGLIPVDTDREDEKVWRARWARKGQGFSFFTEDGYIVKNGNDISHGKTIGSARGMLTRRENQRRLDRHEAVILDKLEHLQENGYGNIMVTESDSTRAGNCSSGTKAFKDLHFPDKDAATVKDVIRAANLGWERKMACAAAFQAIRRTGKLNLIDSQD